MGPIVGWLLLTWGVLRSLLFRFIRRDALKQFRRHYEGEGLRSLSREELSLLQRSTGCVACGRCDGGKGRASAGTSGSSGHAFSMMQFALFAGRHLPDYDAVRRSLAELPDEAFVEAESLCEFGVPLLELSRLIRNWPLRPESV